MTTFEGNGNAASRLEPASEDREATAAETLTLSASSFEAFVATCEASAAPTAKLCDLMGRRPIAPLTSRGLPPASS